MSYKKSSTNFRISPSVFSLKGLCQVFQFPDSLQPSLLVPSHFLLQNFFVELHFFVRQNSPAFPVQFNRSTSPSPRSSSKRPLTTLPVAPEPFIRILPSVFLAKTTILPDILGVHLPSILSFIPSNFPIMHTLHALFSNTTRSSPPSNPLAKQKIRPPCHSMPNN